MEALVGLAIFIFIIWMLFIRGALFKIILAVFAFIGLSEYLWKNYPQSHSTFMTVLGADITYAMFLPSLLIILAMATTSIKNDK